MKAFVAEKTGWRLEVSAALVLALVGLVVVPGTWRAAAGVGVLGSDGDPGKAATLVLTAPAPGATFVAPAQIALKATAVDPLGDIRHVEFFAGDRLIGKSDHWTLDPVIPGHPRYHEFLWVGAPAGAYRLWAKAPDSAGTVIQSGPVEITVSPPINHDQPVVNIKALKAEAIERGDGKTRALIFEVTRSGSVEIDLPVQYTVEGTARNGEDYELLSGEAVIPKGAAATQIMTYANPDDLWEGNESVVLTLQAPACIQIVPPPPTCYRVGELASARAVIVDNPPTDLPRTTLVRRGSTWRYWAEGSAAAAGWNTPGFDDSTWPHGPAKFGFGDPGMATTLRSGLLAAYFRLEFEVADLASVRQVVLGVLRDDGVAVYLNGREVCRDNLPPGPLEYGTLALTVVGGDQETEFWPFALEPAALHEGKNSLAVEVHQVNANSSDLGFDLELAVTAKPDPATLPLISLRATLPETSEPSPNTRVRPAELVVVRDRESPSASGADFWVSLRYGGTATPGLDYVVPTERVVFAPGVLEVPLLLGALSDDLVEGDETVLVEVAPPVLGAAPAYRLDPSSSAARVVIHDATEPPTVPLVGIYGGGETPEFCPPNADCPALGFRLQRTGPGLDAPLTVWLRYEGTASPGVDYEALPEQITFAANQESTSIVVVPKDDLLAEGSETVAALVVPAPLGAPLEPYRVDPAHSAAKGFILDNEPVLEIPVVSIAATVPETGEPCEFCDMMIRPGQLTITRSGRTDLPLTVWLRYGGTAEWAKDYRELPETVTLEAGHATAELEVVALMDNLVEGDEELRAELQPDPSMGPIEHYKIAPDRASATVLIHDWPPAGAVIAITEPASGTAFVAPEVILFLAETVDPKGAITALEWFAGDQRIGESSVEFFREPDPGTKVQHQFGWQHPPVGEHSVTAQGIDATGQKIVSQAVRVWVKPAEPPPARAIIVITAPADGTVFTAPDVVPWLAEAVDPKGALQYLEWFAGDAKIGSSWVESLIPLPPGTKVVHHFAWRQPPAGEHAVTAQGIDAEGNKVVSKAVRIVVRREGPPLPERVVLEVVAPDPEASEPRADGQTDPGLFRILRSAGAKDVEVPVFYWLGGTASNGIDYELIPEKLVLPAGAEFLDVPVQPLPDKALEGTEDVLFFLRPPACPEIVPPPPSCYEAGLRHRAAVFITDAAAPPPPEPVTVEILRPKNGSVLPAGEDVVVAAVVRTGAPRVARLELLIDEHLVAQTDRPELAHTWPNPANGLHGIIVQAVGPEGAVLARASARVHVGGVIAPAAFVRRELPEGIVGGLPFVVGLRAAPPRGTSAYAVEEIPPRGWAISEVSDEGQLDPATGKVKFGPYADAHARVLKYQITPPADFTGRASFEGVASANGKSTPIIGDLVVETVVRWHPADVGPRDDRIVLDELTAYVAAWREGATWPTGPVPIPASFVARAGQLWKQGEAYLYDPAKGTPPECWSSAGRRLLGLDPGTAQGSAGRVVPPMNAPGQAVEVRVALNPPPGAVACAVEEFVPADWSVGAISDGGVFDPRSRCIRWGLFIDRIPTELAYTVTPPEGLTTEADFYGRASFDGRKAVLGGATEALAADAKTALGLGAPRVETSGRLRLTFDGAVGQFCVVETSTNLIEWTDLATIVLTESPFEFTDDGPPGAVRFYRVRAVSPR